MTTLTPEKFKELLLKGQLPKGPITVKEYLQFWGCAALTSLPENLTVNGSLDLEGCKALKSLPENLTVKGGLYLGNCKGLKALPENLTVNGNLDLENCKALKSFYKVKVQGTIFFDDSLIARIPYEELIKHLGMSPEIDALIARRFKEGP